MDAVRRSQTRFAIFCQMDLNLRNKGIFYGDEQIFCNIHPQMSAVIVTVDTPYFAQSNQAGNLSLMDVPEGRYQLNVWHERATPQELSALTRTVNIGGNGTLDLGVIRINEIGYIPAQHPNKHGEHYDNERNRPAYKK